MSSPPGPLSLRGEGEAEESAQGGMVVGGEEAG